MNSIDSTSLPTVRATWAIPLDKDLSYYNSSIYFGISAKEDYEIEGEPHYLQGFYRTMFFLQWILFFLMAFLPSDAVSRVNFSCHFPLDITDGKWHMDNWQLIREELQLQTQLDYKAEERLRRFWDILAHICICIHRLWDIWRLVVDVGQLGWQWLGVDEAVGLYGDSLLCKLWHMMYLNRSRF